MGIYTFGNIASKTAEFHTASQRIHRAQLTKVLNTLLADGGGNIKGTQRLKINQCSLRKRIKFFKKPNSHSFRK